MMPRFPGNVVIIHGVSAVAEDLATFLLEEHPDGQVAPMLCSRAILTKCPNIGYVNVT